MKRIALLLLTLVVSACTAVANAPQQVADKSTQIVETAQAVGTQASSLLSGTQVVPSVTAHPVAVDLCIPPIGWQELVTVKLKSGETISSSQGWVEWFGTDGKLKGAVMATNQSSTPFADRGLEIKVIACNKTISYDPDSVSEVQP